MASIKNIVLLGAGAAIGSLFTYIFLNDRMNQEIQEEIDGVKEYYANKDKELKEKITKAFEPKKEEETEQIKEYKEKTKRYQNYKSISDIPEVKEEEARKREEFNRNPKLPYTVVSVQDFVGRGHEYEDITLTFYVEDQVLVSSEMDDDDEPILNPDDYVGMENLKKLEESGEEVLYVRNDRLATYFEVVLDKGSYSRDVLGIGV